MKKPDSTFLDLCRVELGIFGRKEPCLLQRGFFRLPLQKHKGLRIEASYYLHQKDQIGPNSANCLSWSHVKTTAIDRVPLCPPKNITC